jgi:hypothetical protein
MSRPAVVAPVVLAVLVIAAPASAQLAPADAGDFMGAWTIMLDTPQGTFEQELTLKDEAGKVVAVMVNQMQPEGQRITDISKDGEKLVLKFAGNFQGNPFDATITVTPSEPGKASVLFDVNGGQFTMNGAGTKKP